MKLVIIFGPQAVGKMTVGHELEKITGLKLFHNHMTIDLVSNFFSYNTPTGKKIVNNIRNEIFEEVASSDLEGLIFTFVWYFDRKEDWDYTDRISNIFTKKGSSVYYVELEANLDERLIRNKTEHRLKHNPIKRNFEYFEKELKNSVINHRLNSNEGEIKEKNYIKINNDNLSAELVAKMIKQKFNL